MRSDLATLTPEALGRLSNMGLVKRAQKEIEAGEGPSVREEPDGTVVATFAKENVTAKLVPGKTLKDTPCSCGAKIVCRHRIAAVLVYVAGGWLGCAAGSFGASGCGGGGGAGAGSMGSRAWISL